MGNLEKLKKTLATEKSPWQAEAQWREANENWLSVSFDIAVRVLETLQAKGMTQKDLAERMGVTPQFVSKVVKGQENLSLETIGKLSKALGVQLIEVPREEENAEVVFSNMQTYVFSNLLSSRIATTWIGVSLLQSTPSLITFSRNWVNEPQGLMYISEQEEQYKMPA
ncbi:MAG: helix-turn-helix domain-containing protein [Cyclobacteriaceae bacterium]|jgi:transcriptional regulator with XRE-family HTH domain|nr:helix-turn-helix transcriptional regulator [Flammeovirgaceae bacterium]